MASVSTAATDFGWLWGAFGTAIGFGGEYGRRLIFDRKKVRAEDKAAELDADSKAVQLFQNYANELNPRLKDLQDKQDQLIQIVNDLKMENTDIKIENKELKHENKFLNEKIDKMKVEIEQLQNKI